MYKISQYIRRSKMTGTLIYTVYVSRYGRRIDRLGSILVLLSELIFKQNFVKKLLKI